MAPLARVLVRAPGRVNLIGDHTDYTGGLVMPLAIDRWTVIDGERAHSIRLSSTDDPEAVDLQLPIRDPTSVEPRWGRYIAAVAAELGSAVRPVHGRVSTDIPVGAGLSSSAALEVAAALALGFEGDAVALAQLGRRAEHRASGVPCGIMDQLCIAAARRGNAQLIDCRTLDVGHVELADDLVVLVQFVGRRTLAGSEYAARVAECAAAEQIIGPLRDADPDDADRMGDSVLRRRARHVITENRRVIDFADALQRDDRSNAGRLLGESHASLRDDFAISTPAMDAAVAALTGTEGIHGARMTGGGFGGCLVALAEPGAAAATWPGVWTVRAVDGASIDPFNRPQQD